MASQHLKTTRDCCKVVVFCSPGSSCSSLSSIRIFAKLMAYYFLEWEEEATGGCSIEVKEHCSSWS